MRDVDAGAALDGLLTALAPFVEHAAKSLPAIPAVEGLETAVVVQLHPTVARMLLTGPETALEVVRMVEPELPGHVEIAQAAETFITAGVSGMPEPAADGVFVAAAKPGGGLILLVDLTRKETSCLLAPRGVPLSRATRLFSVKGDCATPLEPSGTVTVH